MSTLRNESDHHFVAMVKPHKPVASCTIAQWLKEMLKFSGIEVSIFKAHSTRSVSVSTAAESGIITTANILKAADWSAESVIKQFYYHPTKYNGWTVLLSTSSETKKHNTLMLKGSAPG